MKTRSSAQVSPDLEQNHDVDLMSTSLILHTHSKLCCMQGFTEQGSQQGSSMDDGNHNFPWPDSASSSVELMMS